MSDYQVKIQQYKTDSVESLKSIFTEVKDFIFTDYRGLSVEKITDLRSKLRPESASYKVVKNRYAKIALHDLGHPEVGELLVGPTAVALPLEESGSVAKILVDFAKDGSILIKGGLIGGALFNAAQIEAYSKLPTRMELIASLMGTMKAPVQNLVFLLNAVPQKLVRTLQAVADRKSADG